MEDEERHDNVHEEIDDENDVSLNIRFMLSVSLQLNIQPYPTRRKVRVVNGLGSQLEKCRNDLAKQQELLNASFSRESDHNRQLSDLRKALDEAKQV
jgi:hypothetical protein